MFNDCELKMIYILIYWSKIDELTAEILLINRSNGDHASL